jgi:hypothetical protein
MGRYVLWFLTAIGVLAWGIIAIQWYALPIYMTRVVGVNKAHTVRMELALDRHAQRMESALERHAEYMSKRDEMFDRVVETMWRGASLSKFDAARTMPGPADTGPFPVFDTSLS